MSFGKSPTDEQVLAELGAGSPDALACLYDRFCDRAWRLARSVCGDDGHAEDAVHEAFMAVWRTAGSYDAKRGGVAAWLLTLVRHAAIDGMRRERRHSSRRAGVEGLARQASSERPVDETASANGAAADLRDLLMQLPEPQREIIALAYYGELSHEEIAQHLGLPAGTVKGRMRLGLEKLRDGFADRTEPPPGDPQLGERAPRGSRGG